MPPRKERVQKTSRAWRGLRNLRVCHFRHASQSGISLHELWFASGQIDPKSPSCSPTFAPGDAGWLSWTDWWLGQRLPTWQRIGDRNRRFDIQDHRSEIRFRDPNFVLAIRNSRSPIPNSESPIRKSTPTIRNVGSLIPIPCLTLSYTAFPLCCWNLKEAREPWVRTKNNMKTTTTNQQGEDDGQISRTRSCSHSAGVFGKRCPRRSLRARRVPLMNGVRCSPTAAIKPHS